MQEQRVFPLNRFQEISERPEDFRLIERIPLNRNLVEKRLPLKLTNAIEGERVHQVVFLDTETTGIEHGFDKIIELGLVKATYSFDRRILLSIDTVLFAGVFRIYGVGKYSASFDVKFYIWVDSMF